MKTCRTCDQEKPESDFYVYHKPWKGGTRTSPYPDCKSCHNLEEWRNEQEQKRLSLYVVRGWAGEVKAALAGLFEPAHVRRMGFRKQTR